jgi:lysophospholipase L1-like esterase
MWHEFLKYSLGPVFLAQGAYLRRTVPELPEPAGDRHGRVGPGDQQPLRVLIVGDSSAAGVGAETQEDALSGCLVKELQRSMPLQWKLIAKTGWTTLDISRYLETLEPESFDVAVSSLGVNDAMTACSAAKFIQRQKNFVALLREKFSIKQFYLSAIPPFNRFPVLPQPLSWFLGHSAIFYNRALTQFIESQNDCHYMPIEFPITPEMLAEDGFHPGPPIYKIWGEMVAQNIVQRHPVNVKALDRG